MRWSVICEILQTQTLGKLPAINNYKNCVAFVGKSLTSTDFFCLGAGKEPTMRMWGDEKI